MKQQFLTLYSELIDVVVVLLKVLTFLQAAAPSLIPPMSQNQNVMQMKTVPMILNAQMMNVLKEFVRTPAIIAFVMTDSLAPVMCVILMQLTRIQMDV